MREWLNDSIAAGIIAVVVGWLTWWTKRNFVTHKELYSAEERARFVYLVDCERCRAICHGQLLSEIQEIKSNQTAMWKKFDDINRLMGRIEQKFLNGDD